jgi:hypothetical protein
MFLLYSLYCTKTPYEGDHKRETGNDLEAVRNYVNVLLH